MKPRWQWLMAAFGAFIVLYSVVVLGFVATTQTVNYTFAKRSLKLLLIDGGHWLVVLLVQGAIIGFMGVS